MNLYDFAYNLPIKSLKRIRLMFKFKYHKLFLLGLAIILAYHLFSNPNINQEIKMLDSAGYIGVFVAGLLFSFGFTTPFAIGFFIALQPQNIFVASLVGGFGALLSDLFIFKFVRISFAKEFKQLRKEKSIKKMSQLIEKNLGRKITNYLIYIFAGIVIASPLPDEIGVTMLAGMPHINSKILALLSFVFNTLGVFIILLFSA